jgi:PAS domain-containing protein
VSESCIGLDSRFDRTISAGFLPSVLLNLSGGCGKLLDMEPDTTASICRQSELLYRALIENAYDTILILDADGRVLYATPAVRNYGRDPAQIVGQFIWSAGASGHSRGDRQRP